MPFVFVITALLAIGNISSASDSPFVPAAQVKETAEIEKVVGPDIRTNKTHRVEKIVPAVPIWKAITHNHLVLGLRFWGVTKALRKEVDLGSLKIRNLGGDAEIKLAGTRKIDGETLPFVTIRYPRKKAGLAPPVADVADMQGRIRNLDLDFAVRVPKRAGHKLVFGYLDPEKLTLEVEAVKGSKSTNFGEPIPFSVGQARITNSGPIAIKRSTAAANLWATGTLAMNANDLDFSQIALSFEGEGNVISLSGKVRMPNQFKWDYNLWEQRLIWQDGQLDIDNLLLQPIPQHQINFGGVALDLKTIAIDQVQISKKESAGDSLPVARLTGFAIDASNLDYRNSTLKGKLAKAITIKQVDAEVTVKNIFEGINLSHAQMKDMQIRLTDLSYQNDSGLKFQGKSLDIDVAKYTSNTVEGAAPDTNAIAKIILRDAPIAQQDLGTVQVEELVADLQGPTDKLSGRGSLKGVLKDAHTQVGLDVSNIFGKCSQKVSLKVAQQGSASFNANIDIFNGEPRGLATVDLIALKLDPEYWRCDWDDPPIGFNLPGLYVAVDWKHFSIDVHLEPNGGPRIDIGKVHWTAEFQPLTGVYAALARGEIRFNKDGAKLCGGHAVAVGTLWTPAFGPNFPDCGSAFCNIPRDILRGIYAFSEAPIGLALNAAALSVVNTVGLFDAGLFESKCR